MRQLFLEKSSKVVQEVAQPLLDDHSALILVHYSFISSDTDVAAIVNAQSGLFSNVPRKVKQLLETVRQRIHSSRNQQIAESLGYSCTGRVIAVGDAVTKFRPGDLVACAGAGYAHHADLACVPSHLMVRVSQETFLKSASVATVGTNALHALRRAKVQLGDRVAVLGLGLLGQLTVQLAKINGCFVVGIDIVSERIELARASGADAVYHALKDPVADELSLLTEHHGIDATIIAADSESSDVLQQAMEITRARGRVVIVGDVNLSIDREPFHQKEIDLSMACLYERTNYDSHYRVRGRDCLFENNRWTENRNMQAFISLIESGRINTEPFIHETVTLEELDAASDRIKNKKSLGVVLCYNEPQKTAGMPMHHMPLAITEKKIRFVPAKQDTIGVALIGAGMFAQNKLLPMLARLRGVSVQAVIDTDASQAVMVARHYGAPTAGTQDIAALEDENVHAVIIASPHRFHAEQALRALKAQKAVFVEKPMVVDSAQLLQMETFLRAHPKAPFCVDYNRSFSPFMHKIKAVVQERKTPLMAHYRVNDSFVSHEHWLHSAIGAGRIIGEACHVIDLFCHLVDAAPMSVSAESLHSSRDDIFPTDNFSVQFTFADGSVCSLFYTAMGNTKLGKERMELFFDGKSILVDDYCGLFGFGLSSTFNETHTMPDRGHEQLLTLFFNALRKKEYEPPIAVERLLRVARLTLVVDELVCAGGGVKSIE